MMIYMLGRVAVRLSWIAYLMIALSVIALGYWLTHRSPPLIYDGTPATVEEVDDDVVRLSFPVRRLRACDVTMDRRLYDARGFRWDLPGGYWTAQDIDNLELMNPGFVRIILPLPKGARRGPMTYWVALHYECDPLSKLFPILVHYSVPMFVTPEAGK